MEQPTLFDDINKNVYVHKLSGERMRIKKLFGNVALCECETTRVITEKPYLATNAAVCSLNNLIKINKSE